MSALANIFSAFGLASAAGLNAYLPLLIVALTARSTDLIRLNEPWSAITNGWVIGALAFLLLIEMTVDKVPAADTINDLINTLIRPAAGAILFAASSGMLGEVYPVLAIICGLFIAGTVHAAKTSTRPAVTASSVGTANWFVSLIEDLIAFTMTMISILIPTFILLFVLLVILFFWRWKRRRARRTKSISSSRREAEQ